VGYYEKNIIFGVHFAVEKTSFGGDLKIIINGTDVLLVGQHMRSRSGKTLRMRNTLSISSDG